MRPIELVIVLVIAGLAIGWIGPLGWALVKTAARYTF